MADIPEALSLSYEHGEEGTDVKSPRRGQRDKVSKAGSEQEANDPQLDPVITKTTPKKVSTHRGGFVLGAFSDDQINFLNDRERHMTYGRQIALWLSRFSAWYNPQLVAVAQEEEEEEEKPSLAKAWAFFEHVTLPRYVLPGQEEQMNSKKAGNAHYNKEKKKKKEEEPKAHRSTMERIVHIFARGERQLTKAEPGERELATKLYSPITTPLSQMGDFGLGYGLYFSTLRYVAMLAFVAGILNLSSLLYFASDEYDSNHQDGVTALLQGSAICTGTWNQTKRARIGEFALPVEYSTGEGAAMKQVPIDSFICPCSLFHD
jgi:hypothetical protein